LELFLDKPPISSARDGLAVAQVTTAAYQSAVCGDFVDLPLSDENHPLIDANDQLIDRLLD
jgi:hypothetical protein